MVSQEQIRSRGKALFFLSEQTSDRWHPKGGTGAKGLHGAAARKLKTWVVGPWAKWSRVAFCRGTGWAEAELTTSGYRDGTLPSAFFCIGSKQKSGKVV